MDFCGFLVKNQSVPGTGNIDCQTDSGETEKYPRKKLSENFGEHPEESNGVSDYPTEKTRIFDLKTQFLEPKSSFTQ